MTTTATFGTPVPTAELAPLDTLEGQLDLIRQRLDHGVCLVSDTARLHVALTKILQNGGLVSLLAHDIATESFGLVPAEVSSRTE
jgi:hypothetical protein